MKRYILSLLIAAAAFISCSDEIALTPAVSFFAETPEVKEDIAIFRLATAFMTDSTERVFPVTFGGSAEPGVDYTASADAFVLGGESPVDSIIVTTLKFGTEKDVILTVELPEGVDGGRYLTSGYTIQDNPAYLTFDRSFGILTDKATISFSLTDKAGKKKALAHDIDISIVPDIDRSTAGDGTDYSFADSTHFTIKAGETKGSLEIVRPETAPTTGKDVIFFSIVHDDIYGDGKIAEMEFKLMDRKWNVLDNKWRIDSLVTDSTFMARHWGETYSGLDLLPKLNKFDVMEFDMEECMFMPSFYSNFKYYFLGESYFKAGPVFNLIDCNGAAAEVQSFLIDETNRYFSSNEKSEDTSSYIGIRLLEGVAEASDTLDLYVFDHTSRSFMPELESEGKYAPEKPVAASPGLYLNARFTIDTF